MTQRDLRRSVAVAIIAIESVLDTLLERDACKIVSAVGAREEWGVDSRVPELARILVTLHRLRMSFRQESTHRLSVLAGD